MKWDVGTCGFLYRKATFIKTRWFDISVLKILKGGHINRHTDKQRQLRVNIDLPAEYKDNGGKFICPNAYLSFWGISIYRADKHYHAFKQVVHGSKYTISFGLYY